MLFDYHIHTARCKHAEGSMEEYVQAGLKAGLKEMGFSDHLPMPKLGPSPWNMLADELPGYVEETLWLKKKYPQIPIRLSAEADFFPDCVTETRRLLAEIPFDYLIGSVHYLTLGPKAVLKAEKEFDWCVDAPEEQEEWKRHAADEVYQEYLRQMCLCAESGLFHIMGHADVLKKFGQRAGKDLRGEYRLCAESFKKSGVLVELNTAGLRNPVNEIYPDLQFLKILREAEVPITLGSDAHRPEHVAYELRQALLWARQAGYEQLHCWAAPGAFEGLPIQKLLI